MTIRANKFVIHSLFLFMFIVINSPFLNQSWVFVSGFPIYAMFCAILLLLSPSIIYLKTSSINYIIGLIFVICNMTTTMGGTPTISNNIQYMAISSMIIFLAFLIILSFSNNYNIASKRFGTKLSYNLFFFSTILIFLDFNGFWSNFINQSRTQTGGSILGYACFFGATSIILWRNYLSKKNFINFFMFISLILFSLIFIKSKGPILILFIICFFMTRNYFFKTTLVSLFTISVYIFSLFRPLYGDGTFSKRWELLKEQILLISENIFTFNIYYTDGHAFHIWVLELFYKINVFSFFIFITLIYVFINTRNSSNFRWILLFYSLIGLISFRLDDIIFSLSLCCALALAEHNAFKLKQNEKPINLNK